MPATSPAARARSARPAQWAATYRTEQKLGKIYRELEPYALYPIDEYFQGTTNDVRVRPCPVPAERYPNGVPLRPPMAQPAGVPVAPPAPLALVPAPRKPAPAPLVASFDISDAVAIANYIRGRFRAGRGLHSIALTLSKWHVPGPHGGEWTQGQVKRVLLRHSRTRPRPSARREAKQGQDCLALRRTVHGACLGTSALAKTDPAMFV